MFGGRAHRAVALSAPVTRRAVWLPSARVQGQLLGRESELAEVERLAALPDVRLVTLTGPSGVGKTHLATVVVDRWERTDTVDVALSAITDPALMGDAVVERVLRSPAACAPADALWQRFAGRPVLMLLDNLEQIPRAGEVVLELLEAYPRLTVLTTSLRPLGATGERVVAVGRLEISSRDDGYLAGRPAPALELFVQRARIVDRDFATDRATISACADVCRVLGGLPLAIELAAARVRSVPPALMAAQLADGALAVLRNDERGVPARHRIVSLVTPWRHRSRGGCA